MGQRIVKPSLKSIIPLDYIIELSIDYRLDYRIDYRMDYEINNIIDYRIDHSRYESFNW